MSGVVEARVRADFGLLEDRGPVVEVVGTPSPTDGITVAAGRPGGQPVVARIEFPHRAIDPGMVALIHRIYR